MFILNMSIIHPNQALGEFKHCQMSIRDACPPV